MKNLSRNEMKNTFGGVGTGNPYICTASCAGGESVSLYCPSMCGCTNNVGCKCGNLFKSCKISAS